MYNLLLVCTLITCQLDIGVFVLNEMPLFHAVPMHVHKCMQNVRPTYSILRKPAL